MRPKHLQQSLAHCRCSGTIAILIFPLVVGAKAHNIQRQCEEVRKDFRDKLPFEFSLKRLRRNVPRVGGAVIEQEGRILRVGQSEQSLTMDLVPAQGACTSY